jgi:Ca-activated chloride channel family protein
VVDQNIAVGVKKVRSDSTYGQWEIESLPKYPSVFGPNAQFEVDRERVSVKVNIKAGIPITNVYSHTHELDVSGTEKDKVVTLSEGRTIDNRDFVLNYRLTGKSTQASILTHRKEKDGYFSLLIEPPAAPQNQDITAREMIFVLDTSGSMSGEPMNASKVFMRHALKTLRPDDYFRIINFGSTSHEFTNSPIRATQNNLYRGQNHIDSLNANGGTEFVPAINQAFSSPLISQTLRIVVFLTDGYIGNESAVIQLINEKIKDARIYAFGVGTSVNRYLLSEMGRIGHGFARYIDPTEDSEEGAIKFARTLSSPLLTDISIDWNKLNVSEVTPEIIPDLFSGDSIRIQGKYEGTGLQTIRVNGKVQGREASLPLQVNLPQENFYDASTSAIPLVWARSKISDYMRQLNAKRHQQPWNGSNKRFSDDELKFKVTTLGLDHSLATKWTSFVAVSRRVVNPQPEITPEAQVSLPMVKGVNTKAYPSSVSILGGRKVIKANNNTPSILGTNMAANSIPEPETVAGLLILMVSGFAVMGLIRRRTGRAEPDRLQ